MTSSVFACTGIVQKAEDNSWVYARTMEFGANVLTFDLLYVPVDTDFVSQTGQADSNWKTKYAHVGFSPFGLPLVADGVNEKGLAGGAFYFPGWASYQEVTDNNYKNVIANLDFVSWALGQFATVKEVREAIKNTKVVGIEFKTWGIVPPLHYVLVDASGDKIIVEYTKGAVNIYDMPLQTVTNSPPYPWHEINARNYIGLSAINDPSISINGDQLSQLGQGSGALGLPGDFTPPSRFIRASFLNSSVLKAKDALGNVNRAFRILNQFDIPRGSVREKEANGNVIYEETQWTSASDLKNLKYYFHSYHNRNVRSIDLKSLIENKATLKTVKIDQPETIQDISSSF